MSRTFYAEINLHLTWHTKSSEPLLTPSVEAIVRHYVRGRCINTPGVLFHEIGGIETHIHLVVSVPPTLTISDWVGQLKGSSTHEANQKSGCKVLDWQGGYGVVSFGTKDLPWVVDYVKNQRERHRTGRTVDRLERIVAPECPAQAESEKPRERG